MTAPAGTVYREIETAPDGPRTSSVTLRVTVDLAQGWPSERACHRILDVFFAKGGRDAVRWPPETGAAPSTEIGTARAVHKATGVGEAC
jgi:hypothetical protein